ncbi:MAG: hypothetical protein B6I26_00075 [Desulfobacteraceae bacterium 4572_130]|nr:MAG: hypothetical protein B6I26_00075 [Desulfobacteraceae bacterium 4572_130]
MASINKVIIIGNLGRDPEIRYSQQGTAVVNFTVATSEVWTDKNGQRQEHTEWHRITVFGKQAENCERYLVKGKQVYVEGKLRRSSYEKQGQTHYSTDIIANTVQFLGNRQDSQSQGYDNYQTPNINPSYEATSQREENSQNAINPQQQSNKEQNLGADQTSNLRPGQGTPQSQEDDIPF